MINLRMNADQSSVIHLPLNEIQNGEENFVCIVLHTHCKNRSVKRWSEWDLCGAKMGVLRRMWFLSKQRRKSIWGAGWGRSSCIIFRIRFSWKGTLSSALTPEDFHLKIKLEKHVCAPFLGPQANISLLAHFCC